MSDITTSVREDGTWSASVKMGFGVTTVYGVTEQDAKERLERLLKRLQEMKEKRANAKPQSQASLQEQLRQLIILANQNGLYDAADWVERGSHEGDGSYRP